MKKLLLVSLFLFCSSSYFPQTLLSVDFSEGFPPTGWTVDDHAGNWSAGVSVNAGGLSPELVFNWSPQFIGQSHFISPPVNTTGLTSIKLMFRHMLDYYTASQVTIGVATRASAAGTWNIVWSKVNPTGNIPATLEDITINNTDVGSATFQVCWFFDGNSYNLDGWYIDDILLFNPLAHDVMVKAIQINNQYVPGSELTPNILVSNFGLNQETFTVTAVIKVNGSNVYTQTSANITLAAGQDQLVTLPNFTVQPGNELFDFTATANLASDQDTSNNHKLKFFNSYTTPKNQVILEIGTGTWCTYCPGAQMGAHDLLSNGKEVGVIEYHWGSSTSPDPFTNDASFARNAYYGINAFPTAVFDGTEYFVGGSHSESMYQYYLPIYEAKKTINSAFGIGIYGTWSDSNYTLTLILNKFARTPDYSDLRLQVALTESNIPFNWQGQTMVHSAERLMTPDQNGTQINFGSGNYLEIPLNFTLSGVCVPANCELVAFIQNNNTKEIYQGARVKLPQLTATPVEMISFSATGSLKGITLNWTTATELNNRGFEVQKSNDGINYFTIAFIKGAGTCTEKRTYLYNDFFENKGKQLLYYRLKQFDLDGKISFSKEIQVEFIAPLLFSLDQNYPNPFNPATKICYSVPQKLNVSLKVYDILGNEVAVLVNEEKEPGQYEINFNALNLSSGTYIYRLKAGTYTAVKKMLFIK